MTAPDLTDADLDTFESLFRRQPLGRSFPPDLLRRLVLAQTDELAATQMVLADPFEKLDLRDRRH